MKPSRSSSARVDARRAGFTPQFKLLIVGNHAPRLHNVDEAMRRRFVIIPFVHRPAVVDRQLETKLEGELGSILQWMIDGCVMWQRDGLPRPAAVSAATEAYFEDQDVLGQWLDECCDLGPNEREGPAKLFESWREYSRSRWTCVQAAHVAICRLPAAR